MRKIEREMNNAVKNKIAWSKANTCTTFDNTIENCFVYYMVITLLPTIMIKKSYLYMMAVGKVTPLRAD